MLSQPHSKELVSICQAIASRGVAWTQGTGGNVSVKDANTVWIKASGLRLDQVDASGIVCIDRDLLKKRLSAIDESKAESENEYSQAIVESQLSVDTGRRPSMEASFHALLPGQWVAHFHSIASLHMADTWGAVTKEWLSKRGFSLSQWVPAVRPGLHLCRAIEKESRDETVFLLQNHGIILQCEGTGTDFKRLLGDWHETEIAYCQWKQLPLISKLLSQQVNAEDFNCGPFPIYFPDSAVFADRLRTIVDPCEDGFRLKTKAWAICKDLCELWLATQILFRTNANFPELPLEISNSVATLPTEVWRRRVQP